MSGYLDRPVMGVGAVVAVPDGVVLVLRRHQPLAGTWSIPGGRVELGETLAQAVAREVLEETGLEVRVGPLVALLDRIHRDADDRVEYHYVLADYACRAVGGRLRAGSDAADVAVVREEALASYDVPPVTADVIRRGLEMLREENRPE